MENKTKEDEKEISRQYAYQKRNLGDGKCSICGRPIFNRNHCFQHAGLVRERMRKKSKCVLRYPRAKSYAGEDKKDEKIQE